MARDPYLIGHVSAGRDPIGWHLEVTTWSKKRKLVHLEEMIEQMCPAVHDMFTA